MTEPDAPTTTRNLHRPILMIAILAIVAWLFLARYEPVPPTAGSHLYVLDRWTGAVCEVGGLGVQDCQPRILPP